MTITIKLKDLLNESLEMNFIADDLFKYINNLKEDKILLDFKGIEFMFFCQYKFRMMLIFCSIL